MNYFAQMLFTQLYIGKQSDFFFSYSYDISARLKIAAKFWKKVYLLFTIMAMAEIDMRKKDSYPKISILLKFSIYFLYRITFSIPYIKRCEKMQGVLSPDWASQVECEELSTKVEENNIISIVEDVNHFWLLLMSFD